MKILHMGFHPEPNGTKTVTLKNGSRYSGEWLTGYYSDAQAAGTDYPAISPVSGTYCPTAWDVLPETVSVYTGLNDAMGRMIFENQILRLRCDDDLPDDYAYMLVRYIADDKGCGWYVDEPGCTTPDAFDTYVARYAEIAGNVFENPELLKL